MALPLSYNVNSVGERWRSTVAAVLGVAGTVGVFVAMLALAQGFKATLVSSGSPRNAMIRRAGATSEMDSSVDHDTVALIQDMPGIARDGEGPLVSPEVVVVGAFQYRKTGTDGNLPIRGVTPRALAVHDGVMIVEGSAVHPGLAELCVGRNAARAFAGLDLGASIDFGGSTWKVVGVMDSHGSAFDSEIWCDASVLNGAYQRPSGSYQSVTARLTSEGDLAKLEGAIAADKRFQLRVDRETAYYAKQSVALVQAVQVVGGMLAGVMGIGAVLGALNTMYSSIADRGREIATLRALGFGPASIVLSFVFESVLIALAGGVVGCIAVLPINGLTTGTMNWQTFSHLEFAFKIGPSLLAMGLAFSVLMGIVGGLPPALRAARLPVAVALREL
ncbi:MAG: ABC transporter permease [Acidobacteriota bacterium]